jgi:hypothetical protein
LAPDSLNLEGSGLSDLERLERSRNRQSVLDSSALDARNCRWRVGRGDVRMVPIIGLGGRALNPAQYEKPNQRRHSENDGDFFSSHTYIPGELQVRKTMRDHPFR